MEPIPTPRGYPIIGNVLDIDPERPNQSLAQIFSVHGPIIRLYLPHERVFVASYDLAKELFDEKNFEKAVGGPLGQMRHAVGDGLFTAYPGERNWELAHRLLMPAFGPLSITSMFPEMQDIVDQMVLKWARFGPEDRIDTSGDFTRLTLDSIAICAMGNRFNSFYQETEPPFVSAMVSTLQEAFARSRRPPLPGALFAKRDRLFNEDIQKLQGIAKDLLDHRRANPTDKHDLLNAMIKSKDPKTGESLDEDAIIRNMITFLIAGHETTSGLLSFLFYELLANPETYFKLQSEVDQVIGKDRVNVQHMSKLPYLEACLRETLRLHPTAPAFSLAAKGDQTLGGRYEIKDKQTVVVFLQGLHRDKSVFGEDAEFFRPERMLGDNFKNFPPNSWKPFGNGVRACIGRPFAWQEAILAVATLFQTFYFTKADPSYQLSIKTALTIKPQDFYIKAKLRDPDFLDSVGSLSRAPASQVKKARNPNEQQANSDLSALKPMQIFFGSNTGTCEAVAQSLATSAREHGFKAEINSLDSAVSALKKDQPLVIVTASYEGEPPDNANQFVQWLVNGPKGELEGVRYAVFGLGNKEWYSTYQKIPTVVDEGIARNGGKRITNRFSLDVTEGNVFDALDNWAENTFWPAMGSSSSEETGLRELKIEIDTKRRSAALKQEMDQGEVTEARLLTKPGAPRKRHIGIRLPTGVTYRAGDYLAILPTNPPATIRRVMKRFSLPWDAMMTIDSSAVTFLPKDEQLSVHDILSSMVELNQPVTAKVTTMLSRCVPDEASSKALLARATDPSTLESTTLLDLLEEHPTAQFSFGAYLAALPAMRVRQYSISSSPLAQPSIATLTWSVVDASTRNPNQARPSTPNFLGICSTYLERLTPGDKIQLALRPSRAGFHPPDDPQTPLLLACAGTGLAPFRGFIAERAVKAAAGASLGPALLFYGLGSPSEDDLYRSELDAWESAGVVSVRRAFSREPQLSAGCKYVQDRVWAEREEVVELFRQGAQVFVCGAGVVGSGVEGVMARIRAEQKGCSVEAAREWVAEMKSSRYWADIFS